MDDYLLGIDVGSTNTKVALYEPTSGKVEAVASRPTVVHHPRPGWSEYDPDELWSNTVAAIREATEGRATSVRAIAVASMAEAGLPIDRNGQHLYPIIAWYDPRGKPQSDRWREWLGRQRLFEITGQRIHPMYSVNRLLWLRDHEPDVLRNAYKWLCVQDFVLWKLSGEYATDYTIASRTMAFDQRKLQWSPVVLDITGLRTTLFPRAYESGTAVGRITPGAAAKTGLPRETIVATGGMDHFCGALAAGILGSGSLFNSMGTAEAYLVVADRFTPHEDLIRHGYTHFTYVVPGHYAVLGTLVAGGAFLNWLVHCLYSELGGSSEVENRAFAGALLDAEKVRPGSDGVFWAPYLHGDVCPWQDISAKAAVIGLRAIHGRGHLVRAALESLCYWLRENLELITDTIAVAKDSDIVAIGGGTRSHLWMQIKADVTGRRVRVVDLPETVAVGAALLAGVGSGVFPSLSAAVDSVVRPFTVYEPHAERMKTYDQCYRLIYHDLYSTLRPMNSRIEELFWTEGELSQ